MLLLDDRGAVYSVSDEGPALVGESIEDALSTIFSGQEAQGARPQAV